MPGRKRKGGGGGSGKRRKEEDANPYDLREMDMDGFDDDEADRIMYNTVERGEEAAIDPRFGHQVEGKGADQGIGGDIDLEEQQAAEEEQARRLEELDEADFLDDDIAPMKKTTKKPTKKETTKDLEALTKFLNQAEAAMEAEPVAVDHSALTPEAKTALLKQNAPELLAMLAEFREKLTLVKDTLSPIIQMVRQGEIPTSDGVSFLEMKMHLFITYLMHLTFYFMLKADGKPVKDSPVVKKLVELRAYIDKLKPIEKKLQHQISRLLSRAAVQQSGGVVADADRANVAALGEIEAKADDGLYTAPRGGAAGLSKDEREARDKRKLAIAEKNRVMAEEMMMQRTATTRKADKLLKNAEKMNLIDAEALHAGDDEEEDLNASIMDLVRSRKMKKALAEEAAGEDDEEDAEEEQMEDDGDEEEEEEEDDEKKMAKEFYEEEMRRVEAEKKRKKKALNAARQHGGKYEETFGEREGEVVDGHRKISSEITRNKGLVPARPKKFKNPRVRSKIRATKLKNKVKAMVPNKSHLRTDIVRSIPMKN